eukprot:gene7180-9790_t
MTSIADIQKNSITKKKSSVSKDEEDFKQRQQQEAIQTSTTIKSWQESSTVKECHLCRGKFTLTNRKHHCRECGNVFCGSCSSYKIVIVGELKRSCLNCYKKAVQKDDSSSLVIPSGVANNKVTNSDSTRGTTQSHLKTPTNDKSNEESHQHNDRILPSWAEAFVFVRAIGSDSNAVVKSAFPDNALSPTLLNDIYNSALPYPIRGTEAKELSFLCRMRDKEEGYTAANSLVKDPHDSNVLIGTTVTNTTMFYNCFVYYRQQLVPESSLKQNETIGNKLLLVRQAIVLVSKWPFSQLAFRILAKLDEAFFWQEGSNSAVSSRNSDTCIEISDHWKELGSADCEIVETASSTSKHAVSATITTANIGLSNDAARDVLMVAFGQMALWPLAVPGSYAYMHFLGEMLQYNVASDVLTTFGANLSFNNTFNSFNLVSLFGPLGFLQHIWILWELMVTGQDIVVISPSPTQCSEFILALGSLMLPLNAIGDFRPYIHTNDSDIRVIAVTSIEKARKSLDLSNSRSKSIMVGISDASVLTKLESFDAAIFLAPLPANSLNDPDMAFKGMRKRNTAVHISLKQFVDTKAKNSTKDDVNMNPNNYDSFTEYFNEWFFDEKNVVNGSDNRRFRKSMLITRHDTSSVNDSKILDRIKKLNPIDRNILGDKMLRDTLTDLTVAFYKPTINAGVSLEIANMRQTAIERAEIAFENEKKAAVAAYSSKNKLVASLMDVIAVIRELPNWAPHNVPTVILWLCYLLLFLICIIVGIPSILLIGGFLIIRIPDKPSREFELFLRDYIPKWVLYPKRYNRDGSRIGGATSSFHSRLPDSPVRTNVAPSPKDFSGEWKRVKLINYDNFLSAQGVGFAQRSIASSMSLTVIITMDKDLTAFRFEEKVANRATNYIYNIGGESIETAMGNFSFVDQATWNGDRLRIKKQRQPNNNGEIVVDRSIENDGKSLKVVAVFTDSKNNKPPVESTVYFDYVGPSSSTPPPSYIPAGGKEIKADGMGGDNCAAGKFDLSGKWKRVKLVNYDNLLAACGVSYVQRKVAQSVQVVHTITMDQDLTAMRLQEKGGPLETNFIYNIDGPELVTQLPSGSFLDKVTWTNNNELLIRKLKLPEQSFEILTHRSLENNGKTIKIRAVYRDLKGNNPEVEAFSYFEYMEPSSSEPPPSYLVSPSQLNSKSGDDTSPSNISKSSLKSSSSVHIKKKKNFSGTWQRTRTLNFEAFLGAITNGKVGYLQRKVAANMALTHTITVDKQFKAVRIQENGGTIDIDTSMTIGADYQDYIIMKKESKQRAFWGGNDNQSLIVRRIVVENGYEMFLTRSIDPSDEDQLILQSAVVDQSTGTRTEATAWFKRSGPSESQIPSPDMSLAIIQFEENSANDGATDGEDAADDDNDDDEVAVAK